MLLQKHKKIWIQDFTDIRNEINEALANLSVSIEHIGSTSVPGLAAKPIIDIDVAFDESVEFDEIRRRLGKTGYVHAGNQGIENREVFKRSKLAAKHDVLDVIPHHLYVCPRKSEELQRHILFRDYLIANSEARIEYQDLKNKIAIAADQDRKKYAELKEQTATEFVNDIIAKAQKGKNL